VPTFLERSNSHLFSIFFWGKINPMLINPEEIFSKLPITLISPDREMVITTPTTLTDYS
jgi:hypothetical protein